MGQKFIKELGTGVAVALQTQTARVWTAAPKSFQMKVLLCLNVTRPDRARI